LNGCLYLLIKTWPVTAARIHEHSYTWQRFVDNVSCTNDDHSSYSERQNEWLMMIGWKTFIL